jgi:hypothetical protein
MSSTFNRSTFFIIFQFFVLFDFKKHVVQITELSVDRVHVVPHFLKRKEYPLFIDRENCHAFKAGLSE